MTADFDAYSDYLRNRSTLGYVYRRFLLYPRLRRELHGRVLDIGCGIGDFLAFGRGDVGIDVNPRLVAHCRSRGLDAHEMPFDRIPFEDGSFDSAVLDNVLEHIADPSALLAEAWRVLKPGGRLVVGVPGVRGYASDSDHKVFYDRPRLERTLDAAGFDLVRAFNMPIRSRVLDTRLPQYCLYATFAKVPIERGAG